MTDRRNKFVLEPLIPPTFTDVDDRREDQKSVQGFNRIEFDSRGEYAAVLAQAGHFEPVANTAAFRAASKFGTERLISRSRFLGQKHLGWSAQKLLTPISKQVFDRTIGQDNPA